MWTLLIVAVVLIAALARARRRKAASPKSFVERMGKFIPADEVFEAWMSGDLKRMIEAERLPTNPIDRHFLLLQIVEFSYRQRQDPQMRALFLKYARQHVAEFEHLAQPLRQDLESALHGSLPRVPTFQYLATVLTEEEDFEGAVEVCRTALSYDLHDNTKGGFEARIARIRKRAVARAG